LRLVRSPFGHALVAIRENQQRATFSGISGRALQACRVRNLRRGDWARGGLVAFQIIWCPQKQFRCRRRRIAGDGRDRRMRSMLGPALGTLFFILFRELFSIWTPNWLLWFGLTFVAFVMFSPDGLVGIWTTIARRFRQLPKEDAAMSNARSTRACHCRHS